MISTQPLTPEQRTTLAQKMTNPAWLGMVFNNVCHNGGLNIESEESLRGFIVHTARVALMTEEVLRREAGQ